MQTITELLNSSMRDSFLAILMTIKTVIAELALYHVSPAAPLKIKICFGSAVGLNKNYDPDGKM